MLLTWYNSGRLSACDNVNPHKNRYWELPSRAGKIEMIVPVMLGTMDDQITQLAEKAYYKTLLGSDDGKVPRLTLLIPFMTRLHIRLWDTLDKDLFPALRFVVVVRMSLESCKVTEKYFIRQGDNGAPEMIPVSQEMLHRVTQTYARGTQDEPSPTSDNSFDWGSLMPTQSSLRPLNILNSTLDG